MQKILNYFNMPETTKATKKLKTYLLEKYPLKTSDKKILKIYTKSITLQYILNQSKINISRYEDKDLKYIEVYIITIEISSKDKAKQLSNIINTIFPKPIILLFLHENSLLLNITSKRVSKTDSTKLVAENSYYSSWVNLDKPTQLEQEFLQKLNIQNHPFTNFYDFYKSYEELIISFNASKFSGNFTHKESNKEILAKIEEQETKIKETVSKIKKASSIREKVNLNIELKKYKDILNKLKEEL